MRLWKSARVFGLGVAIAACAVVGTAVTSQASGTSSCITTSATFVQAVGAPGAPVQVPMNLPVTVCTLPTNVQVILPAFQSLGGQPGSVILPRTLPLASCTSGSAVVPVANGATVAVPQLVQASGSTVILLSSTLPRAAAVPLITCF